MEEAPVRHDGVEAEISPKGKLQLFKICREDIAHRVELVSDGDTRQKAVDDVSERMHYTYGIRFPFPQPTTSSGEGLQTTPPKPVLRIDKNMKNYAIAHLHKT